MILDVFQMRSELLPAIYGSFNTEGSSINLHKLYPSLPKQKFYVFLTFVNVPELLMSSAALRSRFYCITQLTLLGFVLTNLLLVFELLCLVGGIQWQTQEIKVNGGNISVAMLLIAALGLTLSAVLKKANKIRIGKMKTEQASSTQPMLYLHTFYTYCERRYNDEKSIIVQVLSRMMLSMAHI